MAQFQAPDWSIQAAFGFGLFDPTPLWTPLEGQVQDFEFQDGKQHELDRMEAGELTMTLDDRFGLFTPNNTQSAYYNELTLADSQAQTSGLGGTWAVITGTAAHYVLQGSQLLYGVSAGELQGGSTTATYGTALYPILPTLQYTASIWIKAVSNAESLSFALSWFTSGSAHISDSTVTLTDSTTLWTQYLVTGVAPGTAAFVRLLITDTNTAAHNHWTDCAQLSWNPDNIPVVWAPGQQNPLGPLTPVRIIGTWASVPSPVCYTFADTWQPVPADQLNQTTSLIAYDVLGVMANTPLNNPLFYPGVVQSQGGLVGYWRMGDPIGSTSAQSYIGGIQLVPPASFAPPDFGSQDTTGAGAIALLNGSFSGTGSGALLYDTATAATVAGANTAINPSGQGLGLAFQALFSADHEWSMTMLVNVGNTGGSVILSSVNASNTQNWQLYVGDGGSDGAAGHLVLSFNGVLHDCGFVADGLWHHFSLTCSLIGSTGFAVTVDGVQQLNATAPVSGTPCGLKVGQGVFSGTPEFVIQDLAIYNVKNVSALPTYNAFRLLQNTETSGQRITEVLEITGLSSFPQDIQTGVIYVAGETSSQTSVTALDYISTVTDTELGFFFQDPTGVLHFKDRFYVQTNPNSATPQVVMGDNASAGVTYEPGIKIPQDNQLLYSVVQVQANQAKGAGTLQQATNVAGSRSGLGA